jgi:hypothetical protein
VQVLPAFKEDRTQLNTTNKYNRRINIVGKKKGQIKKKI